jgi:6-phosphogluconolactonase (cycloisomerase 2 family)
VHPLLKLENFIMKFTKRISLATGTLSLAASLGLTPAFASDQGSAVYTMSNEVTGNNVLVFKRNPLNGQLDDTPLSFPTQGFGTGGGLGNQNAVVLDQSNRWLYVVNPGSGNISVFLVEEDGLRFLQTTVQFSDPGRGRPISLTVHDDLLYVLTEGEGTTPDEIFGFRIQDDGTLVLVATNGFLSAPLTDPAQIQFSPDGDLLIVTEKATNRIDTFTVDANGQLGSIRVHNSAVPTPFGFSFGDRNQVFVSEANGGLADSSVVSAYRFNASGDVWLVDTEETTETAACWVVVSPDGRFAWV